MVVRPPLLLVLLLSAAPMLGAKGSKRSKGHTKRVEHETTAESVPPPPPARLTAVTEGASAEVWAQAQAAQQRKDYAASAAGFGRAFQYEMKRQNVAAAGATWEESLDKAAAATSKAELSWMLNVFPTGDLFMKLCYNYIHANNLAKAAKAIRVYFLAEYMLTQAQEIYLQGQLAQYLYGEGKFWSAYEAELRIDLLKEADSPEQVHAMAKKKKKLKNPRKKKNQPPPPPPSPDSPAVRDSLVNFCSGLNQAYVNIGRNLLQQGAQATATGEPSSSTVLTEIDSRCGGGGIEAVASVGSGSVDGGVAGIDVLSAAVLRSLVARCTVAQDVINRTITKGADVNAVADQGFNALHYAASFGEAAIVQEILAHSPNVVLETPFGQTALHLAVVNGHIGVIPMLIAAGVPLQSKDSSGRTAKDAACFYSWASEAAQAFGTTVAAMCKQTRKKQATAQKANASAYKAALQDPPTAAQLATAARSAGGEGVGGHWLSSKQAAQQAAECDVEIRVGLKWKEFANDYFLQNRPVLLRGALVGKEWNSLRKKWKRAKFAKLYGAENFTQDHIPYAETFGLPSNQSTVGAHLEYMNAVFVEQEQQAGETGEPPRYIFTSYDEKNGVLLKDYFIPSVFREGIFKRNPNPQFYIGPARSGAPFHVHSTAANVLVYGRKRWALIPPPLAQYNTRHPTKVFAEYDRDQEAQRQQGVLHCIQESGDILVVPDGWAHATLNLAESVGWATEMRGWSGWS